MPPFGTPSRFLDKAMEYFNKAISLDAMSSAPHFGLGNLYLQKGDKDSALKQHKILSSLDKKLAEELYKKIQPDESQNRFYR